MTDRIYEGDVGTQFLVDAQNSSAAPIDLTGMTVSLEVWKPGASTPEVWAGSVSGTTSIAYTSVAGNFDTVGQYRFQSKVVAADGIKTWRGVTWFETIYRKGT